MITHIGPFLQGSASHNACKLEHKAKSVRNSGLPPLKLLQTSDTLLILSALLSVCLRRPTNFKLASLGKELIGKSQVR